MINLDFWYNDKVEDIDRIDVVYYSYCYRGNMYINNKVVGDFETDDSCLLEKTFPQLIFNW